MASPYYRKVLSLASFISKQFYALSPSSLDSSSGEGREKGKKRLPIAHKQKKDRPASSHALIHYPTQVQI